MTISLSRLRAFPPSAEWTPPPDLQVAETVEKGHGRIEIRHIKTTESINEHLDDWVGVKQVCKIIRQREIKEKHSTEIVYAITSLPREKASAEYLLELSRRHWGIENRLHYVRDVTMGEDQSRTRAKHGPQLLTALRNTVLTIFRKLGFSAPVGMEHFSENREEAIVIAMSGRTE